SRPFLFSFFFPSPAPPPPLPSFPTRRSSDLSAMTAACSPTSQEPRAQWAAPPPGRRTGAISTTTDCWTSSWPTSRADRASCWPRSEEHTSELQSLTNLVCRLLLEKKKQDTHPPRGGVGSGRGNLSVPHRTPHRPAALHHVRLTSAHRVRPAGLAPRHYPEARRQTV